MGSTSPLAEQVTDNVNPLSTLFDTLIQRYCRNNQVFLSIAFQSLSQIDQSLRNTVLSLGTIVAGRVSTIGEARVLADVLFRKDPYRVKHFSKVWGKVDPPPYLPRSPDPTPARLTAARLRSPDYPYYILDHEPEHMALRAHGTF
jgi:hypothetical protein